MRFLSKIYQVFASLHRFLFEIHFFKKVKVSKPVLSVGNISMGGSGKTPLTAFLYSQLSSLGKTAAIITKSYKATLTHAQIVPLNADPQVFGDEAVFFKNQFPDSLVISGPQKWESARLADTIQDVDVILIDDGFQHHRLHKNWNAVVVDLSSDHRAALARESHRALKYASALFCSRVELSNPEAYENFKAQMIFDLPIFQIINHSIQVKSLSSSAPTPRSKTLLVSAIGRPEQFHQMMKIHWPESKFETLTFNDHHSYSQDDVNEIETKAVESLMDQILCTEKDFVKLQKLKLKTDLWSVVKIQARVEPHQDWNHYFSKLCKDLKL